MLSGLAKLFKRDHRTFEAFQIEISSYSSLESQFSPRAVFAEKWLFEQMPLETYRKIAQNFSQAKWVIFRGWGDPLENEDFPAMFHLARQAGCLTGLVTHGFYLTPDISRQLIEEELDFITVNLKEIPPAGEEGPRITPEFEQTLEQIRNLVGLKKSLGRQKPSVRLSHVMTRLNMGRLSQLVPAAAQLSADEVIVKNLDYLPDDRWNILRTFHHESPTPAFQEAIDEILRLGRELKMPVRCAPLKAEEMPVCEAEPHRSLFFSVDGSIAPCMFLRLPKRGKIPRIFLNREYAVEPMIFGNINGEELSAVWGKEDYRAFRKVFEARIEACTNADSLFDALSSSSPSLPESTEPPPLCESCRTCYKACGI